ncbi:MAG TPA: hypothetical protein GXZ32_04470 [Clostridiales bacterium]|nr:hypothetical protein [Clostridiales bacterium]
MFSIFRPFRGVGTLGLLAGLGIAMAGYIMAPKIKKAVLPAAEKGIDKVKILADRTKEVLNQDRVEAAPMPNVPQRTEHHNKKSEHISYKNENLLKQLSEQTRQSKQAIEELKNTILSLREEVSHLKTHIGTR